MESWVRQGFLIYNIKNRILWNKNTYLLLPVLLPLWSQPIMFCPDYFFCFHSLLFLPLPCPTTFTKVRVIFSNKYVIISFPCLKLFNRVPCSFKKHGLQRLHVVLFIPLSWEWHSSSLSNSSNTATIVLLA